MEVVDFVEEQEDDDKNADEPQHFLRFTPSTVCLPTTLAIVLMNYLLILIKLSKMRTNLDGDA